MSEIERFRMEIRELRAKLEKAEAALNKIGMATHGPLEHTTELSIVIREIVKEALKNE